MAGVGVPLMSGDVLDASSFASVPEGGFALLSNVHIDTAQRGNVPAVLHFDANEELLWVATNTGRLISYYGTMLEKYTAFAVAAAPFDEELDELDVRQVRSIDAGVLALTKSQLRCKRRTGLNAWCYKSSNLTDMRCMELVTNAPNSLLLGGCQSTMLQFDLEMQKEQRVCQITQLDCTTLKLNDKFAFCGDSQGQVTVRSINSLEPIHVFNPHQGPISQMDVCGMKLITSGYSSKGADQFLKMYDLRTLKALPPISVPFRPTFVQFLPIFSDSRVIAASQQGEFQVFDIGETAFPTFVDTGGMPIYSMDVSPSKQCVVFGDGAGMVHLFSDRPECCFNADAFPTEFADPIVPAPHSISFGDELAPLAMIPAPIPQEGYWASDWPPELCKRVYRVPLPMEAEIAASLRMNQFVGSAPNPWKPRAWNQVPYDLNHPQHTASAFSSAALGHALDGSTSSLGDKSTCRLPKVYRKPQVKSTKLTSDDFNYKQYNKTEHSGIECPKTNAYVASLLLSLYEVDIIKSLILSHLCIKENCLACEAHFLFRMLEDSAGCQPCSANNFIRAFRSISQASALGLIINEKDDESVSTFDFDQKIQSFHRFFLQQLSVELSEPRPLSIIELRHFQSQDSSTSADPVFNQGQTSVDSSTNDEQPLNPVERVFASRLTTTCKCHQNHETRQENRPLVITLFYPPVAEPASEDEDALEDGTPFSRVLERSICSQQTGHSYCEKCAKYTSTDQQKTVRTLPRVLALETRIASDADRRFYGVQQRNFESASTAANEQELSERLLMMKSRKPCRYGVLCNRSDCRFTHPSGRRIDSTAASDTSSLSLAATGAATVDVESNDDQRDSSYDESNAAVTSSTDDAPINNWLLAQFYAHVDQFGKISIHEVKPDEESNVFRYVLRSVVFSIVDSERSSTHLVSCVKADVGDEWLLFNEISVSTLAREEALLFDVNWKVPCLLHYVRDSPASESAEEETLSMAQVSVLSFWQDECLAVRRRMSSSTFVPLDEDEIPKRGSMVAVDAEFVILDQEETEIRVDGSKSTVKPSHMTVARVSCVRGDGPMEGVPFMDDYITTQDKVVDYLTKFSGIKPADLDPNMSSKHLTTLKAVYLKLRYMVDNGIVFIGHGLANDFRVINIVVPQEQIKDTVHLFHISNQRMVSLRFLAWYFLGLKIQSDTHDSVEDAKTVLKLYRKYEEFMATENGEEMFKGKLKELYERGNELNWTVPSTLQ